MFDLAYTWVDGAAPGYAELCRRHAIRPEDLNPERFRDQHDLLRFSLRSVQRYLPWVGRVLLFTCRPQRPAWASPALEIIHHDELMDHEFLPTFSCNVIESYLHRLPSRTRHLLYCNDDFLFGAPVAPEDFLTPAGRVRIYGTVAGERLRYRTVDGNAFPPLGLLEHTPYLIERSLWSEMLQRYAEEVARTRSHRFRQPDDVRMDRLWRYFMLRHHRERCSLVSSLEVIRNARFLKLTNKLARLPLDRRFLCLNDDQGPRPDLRVNALVRRELERRFPEKSRWEL